MTTALLRRARRVLAVLAAVGIITACQPEGAVDQAVSTPLGVKVDGWAWDPDSPDSIDVHLYIDGAPIKAMTTNGSRPDVAALKHTTDKRGFSFVAPVSPGAHQACVYGIDRTGDANALIGCRAVVVPSGDPIGNLDAVVEAGGGVQIRGWALDPNTTSPIDVHIYVDANPVAVTTTNIDRADVQTAYPGTALKSGFALTIPKSGSRVCAYGINVGVGTNALIGCQTMPGTPTPTTTTTPPGPTTVAYIVTPGAFCSEHDSYGRTTTGLLMQCTITATDSRYRWRQA